MDVIIDKPTSSAAVNLVLDTLKKNKQAIVFVNSKRSAEKVAEDISREIKDTSLKELSEKISKVVSPPTKQCERLGKCVLRGAAFHHAGLRSVQRQLIEDGFRDRKIKVICCTPTLAYGLDLPAYRVIIRDLRRFGPSGLSWIPVLEYLQQAGRAGRPKYDTVGEAIVVAKTEEEQNEITDRYINGEPEDIFSKLAVEPVLRMYVLSLIATGFVRDREGLLKFFSKTFWAYQFADMDRLEAIIDKVLLMLEEFEFIKRSSTGDFVSADSLEDEKLVATRIGKRVAELYIDPLTAYKLIECLRKASSMKKIRDISLLLMITNTLEMRPLLRVKSKEYDQVQEQLLKHEPVLLEDSPSLYDPEYDVFLDAVKTALMFNSWVHEEGEDILLERYSIRPGELFSKIDRGDWLLYSAAELGRLLFFRPVVKEINKMRLRLKYGACEELLILLQLKNIGKVRSRKLYSFGIKTLGDLRKIDATSLAQIVGKQVAVSVKEQLGEKNVVVGERKRKGQVSLRKF